MRRPPRSLRASCLPRRLSRPRFAERSTQSSDLDEGRGGVSCGRWARRERR